MISVERILVNIKALFVVVYERINDPRVVTEARLDLEAFDRGMSGRVGTVNAYEFDVFLAVRKNMQVLDNEHAFH